jgi:hypothetical protein
MRGAAGKKEKRAQEEKGCFHSARNLDADRRRSNDDPLLPKGSRASVGVLFSQERHVLTNVATSAKTWLID